MACKSVLILPKDIGFLKDPSSDLFNKTKKHKTIPKIICKAKNTPVRKFINDTINIYRLYNEFMNLMKENEDNIMIIGTTASGKSDYARHLQQINSYPVINFDSRQFFKDLPSLTCAEKYENHHFFQILESNETHSIGKFYEEIQQFPKKILVGGSIFYAFNLLKGINSFVVSQETKEFIKKQEDPFGLLCKLYSSHKIHKNDHYRINNMLESLIETGYPQDKQPFTKKINAKVILIKRNNLLDSIKKRTELLWPKIIEEVENFIKIPRIMTNSFQSIIGFKEIKDYLHGNINHVDCKNLIILHTYQYAKYQEKFIKKFIKEIGVHEIIEN